MLITARKRSLLRLCFYRCVSVHRRGCVWQGGHAWQGACVAGGHAWWGACMAGGHVWQGACMARGEGVHGRGACMVGGMHVPPRQMLRLQHTVNERAVRILLECILVLEEFFPIDTFLKILLDMNTRTWIVQRNGSFLSQQKKKKKKKCDAKH